MVNFLNIVAVLKMLEEQIHILYVILRLKRNVGCGNTVLLSGFHGVSRSLESFADRIEIVALAGNLKSVLVSGEVTCARLERRLHKGVLINLIVTENDNDAFVLEHIAYTSGLSESSAVFVKEMTDIAAGTVAVIRCGFNDYRHSGMTVALINDLFENNADRAAVFLYNAFYIVVRHVESLCSLNQIAQLAV